MKKNKLEFAVNYQGRVINGEDCEIRLYGFGIFRVYVDGNQLCNDKSARLLINTGRKTKKGIEIFEELID